ncbi:hypothetical protein [Clostridium neonatale]|nr:hypothetical protein CNEO_45374 [Clostridium neonatale]
MYDVEGDDKGKIVRHANGGVQIKLISNKRFWFMQRIELNQELKNIFRIVLLLYHFMLLLVLV